MYNVQFMIYIVYRFSQNVQECTILLNFQIHCVQNVQNVHSSHPEDSSFFKIQQKTIWSNYSNHGKPNQKLQVFLFHFAQC